MKIKKWNWKRIVKTTFGVIVCLIGLALIFNGQIAGLLMKENTAKYSIDKVSTKQIKKNTSNDDGNYNFASVSAISANQVLQAQLKQNNLNVLGYIAMPDVGIDLPIFSGVGDTAMLYGAGTMKSNQVMGKGNYTLASHHVFSTLDADKMLFSPLVNAKKGMTIYLTDKNKVYSYTVTQVYVVTPEHVEVLDDHVGQNEITLVTCTDAQATKRIIVKGELTKTNKWSKASSKQKAAFKVSQKGIN
ncbi:TPA: class A sortase [Streptococcus agalactiae]|nr:class A sortase [Streptococcus agalactiae]HEO2267358.1 class A sortase [Streptococcus agalactiae]HEO7770505.1 class A sortase [Streptococcus agalactiae]